jgi:hypothetical protein
MHDKESISVSIAHKKRAPRGSNIIARLEWWSYQDGECRRWMGAKMPNGYGRITVDGKGRLVHRVAYEVYCGRIPEGMTIDHLCGCRDCINPSHMEVVTRGENTLRGSSPSAQQKRQTHCKRGHPLSNAYRYGNRRLCRACRSAASKAFRARRKIHAS